MAPSWKWRQESKAYGNYGNPNQWTVAAGLESLARESAQNSADARLGSQKARIDYCLIRLKGEALRAFQQALGWSDLKQHLQAMTAMDSASVMAGQIRAGLEAAEARDELLVLRIADYGCRGLTGPEFASDDISEDDYGNFIKLCRLDLFSGKEQAAGGSFGLGKAVYWRFSRFQTALFNSTLPASESLDGKTRNRLFGVTQGTAHRHGGLRYQGRGYFGFEDHEGDIASMFVDDALVKQLHIERDGDLPGTTALIVGFHDPDEPDTDLLDLAKGLEAGLEESFWPLLARDRMEFTVSTEDEGATSSYRVDPRKNFTELTAALQRYDRGEVDSQLERPMDVVVHDIPIDVPKRKGSHGLLTHTAKLMITLSDEQRDSLENRVCLFRKPEMVVETIERVFPGVTYHAFLLAGAAVNPSNPSDTDRLADDFLRFAEPPAHDRWIPRGAKVSQANLGAHYIAPWNPNLRAIARRIEDALRSRFGEPPPPPDKAPEAVARHLRFLSGGQGSTVGRVAKPRLELISWAVDDEGRWVVTVSAEMRNRPEGWVFSPSLVFVGVDGRHERVEWEGGLTAVDGCRVVDSKQVVVDGTPRGRLLRARFAGQSDAASHPIPARQAAVDVVAMAIGQAVSP